MKTQEEIEQSFGCMSPYWAYRQGINDGVTQCWDAFRANAAKDIFCAILTGGSEQTADDGTVFRTTEQIIDYAICAADVLIKQLQEGKE